MQTNKMDFKVVKLMTIPIFQGYLTLDIWMVHSLSVMDVDQFLSSFLFFPIVNSRFNSIFC